MTYKGANTMSKTVCPKCGSQLLFEEIGSYGRIHKVRQNGTIGRRARTQLYETDGFDSAMVYCLKCGDNKEFRIARENGEEKIVLEKSELDL